MFPGRPGGVGRGPSFGNSQRQPAGGSSTLTYTGEVPPGTGSLVDCQDGDNADVFHLDVTGTNDDSITTLLTIRLEWDPTSGQEATNDLALQVYRNGNLVGESDGGTSSEVVALQNPAPGHYDVFACAFANTTPQPYSGKISLNSTPKKS
jgi:hypothetical protein